MKTMLKSTPMFDGNDRSELEEDWGMPPEEQQYVDEQVDHVDDYMQPEKEIIPFDENLKDDSALTAELELEGDGRDITFGTISVGGSKFAPPRRWEGTRVTQIPLNAKQLATETAQRKRELAEAVARAKAQNELAIQEQITGGSQSTHFKDEAVNDGRPIFLFDFVYHWCLEDNWWMNYQTKDNFSDVYIRPIIGINRDCFSQAAFEDHGVLLQIHEYVPADVFFRHDPRAFDHNKDWEGGELLFDISDNNYIPVDQIGGWANVSVDRYSGETFTDPSPFVKERKKTFPKTVVDALF
ncbi:hypothetical protein Daus18300_014481 [Diaporthe australafricana]|uniref:Uncharacterized protein n=1 Tax=Diaporthe australafricana TaxID=127596 RepID=A0ABR3VV24_9PEZI